jgi:hypothetical protein
MVYRNVQKAMTLGCLVLSILGCRAAPEPQQVGVFAATNHGLLELTTYGKQIGENVYSLSSLAEIPKAAKVERFYVNMPGSTITEVKVFWLTALDKNFDERNQTPLDTSIETGKGNVYRINCAGLSDKKGGYVLLKVPMPLGVADRAYVVQVTG